MERRSLLKKAGVGMATVAAALTVDAFDAISKGAVQMGSGSPYFWAGKSTT